ncbi:cytochrome c [Alsobacter sp. SYSU M60028]|uniref:Cytochrome c n=1 Tax=Alsobacter ponti TaxID=2962936 RepID=A0ABT1L8M2_9HYPH|nr:cytochrome c [Alsobacter ponti]MCP8937283.1 cytochrome c [Alsobacter ponti]
MRVRSWLTGAAALVVLGAAAFWALTAPATFTALRGRGDAPRAGAPDLDNGRTLFNAGGCSSCHARPGQDDRTLLGGGLELKSPFGSFYPPNISPDPTDGIGGWTVAQFIRAMREGVSPDGRHYYPAFPYTTYQRLTAADLGDLFAYIRTLPATPGQVRAHDLAFPFTVRRGLGLWKLAFLDGKPLAPDAAHDAEWNRGRYLVEAAGHCAECHSPRNLAGAVDASRRYAGGPNPEGRGTVPNITPDESGIGSWSRDDIVELLKTGFTPEFDSVGGSMAAVVRNTAQLSDGDREAMAAYLKSLKPLPSAAPKAN